MAASRAEERNMAQIASFREAVRSATRPVALAGAGLSAASGIPTFRGAGGLWRKHDAMSLATPRAFQSDPSKVWQFYHYRRQVCLQAQPNLAHSLLARLATPSIGAQIFPSAEQGLLLVTQNVDGLSTRAAESIAHLQPRAAIEMHGSLFRLRCTSCGEETANFDSPVAKSLAGTEDLEAEYKSVAVEELPRCTASGCNGLLRPAVVWFGESIPSLGTISRSLADCDLLLVLGTSSTVYPAAGFADQVQSRGGRAAVFNLEEADGSADWFFEGPVEQSLPWALGVDATV